MQMKLKTFPPAEPTLNLHNETENNFRLQNQPSIYKQIFKKKTKKKDNLACKTNPQFTNRILKTLPPAQAKPQFTNKTQRQFGLQNKHPQLTNKSEDNSACKTNPQLTNKTEDNFACKANPQFTNK